MVAGNLTDFTPAEVAGRRLKALREERRQDAQRQLLRAAEVLLPILAHYCNQGWPGLSERDRNEANDARVDLHYALQDLAKKEN